MPQVQRYVASYSWALMLLAMRKPARVLPSNVKWYSARQRSSRQQSSSCQIAALRLNDLARLFRARYGTILPDDDAGRDDIEVAAAHLASLAHPRGRIERWLELWAPWLTLAEQRDIIVRAIASPRHWSADQLAWRLRLTDANRTTLGITTIGAIDCNKAARKARRKAKDRLRHAMLRAARKAASAP